MSDLVKELREAARKEYYTEQRNLFERAAARIEADAQRIAELEGELAALKEGK